MLQPPRQNTLGIFMPFLYLPEIPSNWNNWKEESYKEALHMESYPQDHVISLRPKMKLKLKDRIKRDLESKAGVWFVWIFVVYF